MVTAEQETSAKCSVNNEWTSLSVVSCLLTEVGDIPHLKSSVKHADKSSSVSTNIS